jgi:hypothetical protein
MSIPLYRALLQQGGAFVDKVGALSELGRRMWLSVPTLEADTYTPTLTAVANVAASTAYALQYSQVGSVVTVSGQVAIDPTAGATLTRLGISLPVPSSLSAVEQVGGTAVQPDLSLAAAIRGDTTNDRAELAYTTGADVASRAWAVQFSYLVVT